MTVEAMPRTGSARGHDGGSRPKPIQRRPVAIDLFAGAGGLSVGLEQAGFDVVASVEYDPIHAAVHAYNFPRTTVLCADITSVSADTIRDAVRCGIEAHGQDLSQWDGRVDLVAGGPPCQGFSTIGKRLLDDTRNRLVFQFYRIVNELRPRYFLMENVPGMLAGGHKSAILDRLIEEFRAIGYSVVEPPRILKAAEYGVPQDRRRLIVLGAAEGLTLPAYPRPRVRPRAKNATTRPISQEPWTGDLPIGPSVLDAIGDLPDVDAFASLAQSDETVLLPSQIAAMDKATSDYAARLRGREVDPDDYSHPRSWDPSRLTSSMRTVHTALSVTRFDATEPGEIEPVSRFYRLTADGLCNTIRAGTGSEHGAYTSPRPIHPIRPRVLTVREAARLHSFPDWFRLHRTKWHGFRQVGNAVPPLLARAVGAEIMASLGIEPTQPTEVLPMGDPALLTMVMSAAREHFDADAAGIPARRTRPTSANSLPIWGPNG